jgi:hypothetical protein
MWMRGVDDPAAEAAAILTAETLIRLRDVCESFGKG